MKQKKNKHRQKNKDMQCVNIKDMILTGNFFLTDLLHVIVGVGFPIAWHVKVNGDPGGKIWGDFSGRMLTIGGAENVPASDDRTFWILILQSAGSSLAV
uniref:Uncharacterized protein n=1 Tax=Romanomermis culicivorax TaxID=13658 RepID=A0A915HIH5_ROMCU